MLACGFAFEHDALCRNEELKKTFQIWNAKAERILMKDRRAAERKRDEQKAVKNKSKAQQNISS
jgi:hypothetical protein